MQQQNNHKREEESGSPHLGGASLRQQTMGVHTFSYRVYYEDTDAGGVVYYANYLKFFERARTDFFRAKNIIQSDLAKNSGIVFVVRNCQIDFIKPAKLDDILEVSVILREIKAASIKVSQEIKVSGNIVCKFSAEIVSIHEKIFKPTRIPQNIIQNLQ